MKYASALLGAVILAGCHTAPVGFLKQETQAIELDKSESMHAELKMGAGELHVDGGSVRLADLDFAYNVESWKPRVRYRSGGTHGDLDIEQPDNSASLGDTEYRWAVKLNNKILTDLSVDMGAGEANLNIGEMRLRDVDVEIGAGELKMDLRGTPKSSYSVRIEGGAGSAEVRLPASVGIWATARGGIGNIDVQGLERREDHWVNPRALNSPVLVRIDVQGGVGEIKLIAE